MRRDKERKCSSRNYPESVPTSPLPISFARVVLSSHPTSTPAVPKDPSPLPSLQMHVPSMGEQAMAFSQEQWEEQLIP